MHSPCSIRRENGAALIISLLMVAVFLIVGSGALTNSRIETQIASNDTKVKQALLAAEYAMALGESTVELTLNDNHLATRLFEDYSGSMYSMKRQPKWDNCTWDDRDSINVATYFADPVTKLPADRPLPPPMFMKDDEPEVLDPHKVPRLMIETKARICDDLVLPCKAWTSYYNISAHGAWAKWTALGNGQAEDKRGQDHPDMTYNERYPGTRVVIQSIYAKRY